MTSDEILARLESLVVGFEGTTLGTSCKKKSAKVGKKNFLFFGPGKLGPEVMLKLRESLDEALEVEKLSPKACKVGKGGWVTLQLVEPGALELSLLEKWVSESYTLFRK